MWYEVLFEGIKNTMGKIIGAVAFAFFSWSYTKYRTFMKMYKRLKQELENVKAELSLKEEALRQVEAQKAEEINRREEIERQFEAQRQELEREKAKRRLPPMSDNDFIELCKSSDSRKVEEAIMNGANVNARTKTTWTVLMEVVDEGITEVAELLLKHGADVNAKSYSDDKFFKGWTALMCAAWNGNTEMAELLLKHGADVNATNYKGKTALGIVGMYTEMGDFLRKYGAKPVGFWTGRLLS